MNENDRIAECPNSIAVIGGGRWVRVLTDVLSELIPPSVKIALHSPRNSGAMSAWVSSRRFDHQIHVTTKWSQLASAKLGAVIVANAAKDHEKATMWALEAGIPVLVEKPVTLAVDETQRLINLSRRRKIYLASAHVFLFARYLERFVNTIADAGDIQSIRMDWMESTIESRYGEQKIYDPSLPVFVDCLPHVLSIVNVLIPDVSARSINLNLKKGGAHLEIEFMLGNVPCYVQVARNSGQRQRYLEVNCEQKSFQLDFSSEPGTITYGSSTICGDPDWATSVGPVASMLTAFFRGVESGELDNRLDNGIGLYVNKIIEQISGMYRLAIKSWLISRFNTTRQVDDDLRYSLSEILQAEGPLQPVAVEQQIKRVGQRLSSGRDEKLLSRLTVDPVSTIRSIAL